MSQDQVVAREFPGQQKWVFEAESQIRSTPIINNGRVLIRTNRKLYSLDASNGDLKWSVSIPKDWHVAPPLIQDGIIIVSHPEGVNAFRLATGELIWQTNDMNIRNEAFLAASNEEVVILVNASVFILDITTGELLRKIENPYGRMSALVALDDNQLYVVFRDQIRSYDIETGELHWSIPTEEWSLQSGLFDSSILYLKRRENGISAYSTSEKRVLWRRDDLFISDYPLTKHQNFLFIGSRGSAPVAIDASTGETLWEAEGVWNYDVYQTPLVVDNIVYIRGLYQEKIFALSIDDGKVIGFVDLGLPNIISANADYSLGPVTYDDLIIFPVGEKLLAYGK
jgi:glucose dehydrogenase